MESSGTGAEDHSDSGPSPSRNPFDLANILGSSPFTGSMTSPGATIYPPLSHMPSAFSMLEPHPMFPGAALLPFGGLGSLGEGLMSAGVLGHTLGSAGNGADWWRMASEQASRQMTTDCTGPGAFYAGLNGTFGNPLFSPLFSSGLSGTTVPTSSDGASANKSSSTATSGGSKSGSSKSHHKQSMSSPIPKESRTRKEQRMEAAERGNLQESSSLMSPTRSAGKGTIIGNDGMADTPIKNNSTQLDYSLENSLLSAEAALYSASPFFFPFGAMAALSSAFGGMPFPGSSALYSCPTTTPAYTSPFTIFPSHSSTSTSKMSANESPVSQKSKSESRTWTPVSRMSTSSTPGANTPGANTPVSPGSTHRNRSLAISPCETGKKSGGDHRKESVGTATSVIVSRMGSSHSGGSSARTLSIADHKMQLSGKTESLESDEHKNRCHISSPQKMVESKLRMISTPDNQSSSNSSSGRQSKNSEKHNSSELYNDSDMYSLDGAIDLSIKKPRTDSSPARVSSAAPTKSLVLSKSSSADYHRDPTGGSLVSSSQADVLSALAHSHQVYAEHQAQLLANNQMAAAAAAAGLTDPLSFNLAAAALLPQMYDGMTAGLFYPPSALAAMAAASGVMSNVASPTEKAKGSRGRGRRRGLGGGQQSSSAARSRGGRGSSSLFISSLMPMTKKPEESVDKAAKNQNRTGTGGTGTGMTGKGRGKATKGRMMSMPIPYLDSEEQRHQQDLLRHQMESELQQQQHHHQLKLLQKMHNKKEASSVSGGTSTSATDASAAKGSQSRRETLTSKLQHHQSKLAQALMGQDGLITTSPALLGSPLFKGAELALDQQLTSTEYDSSIRTDSDLEDESSSSECSGSEEEESPSDGESQSTQGGSDGGNSAHSVNKRKRENAADDGGPGKKRRRTILDETEIRVPLDHHGWQRETRIRSFTPKKIVGEVVYITPCGKKLRNYYEVEKYLEKSGVKHLSRENFTFSTKVNIGKFYELGTGDVPGYNQLSEAEVMERYVAIEARKKRILEKRLRAEQREERRRQTEELSLKMAEARLQKKFEQQELAKRVAEMKIKKREERQQQKEMLHRARQLRAMELRKSKEKQKLMRQQERFNRQQQMKMEKEVRSQQVNEEKEVKKQQSVVLKEQTAVTAPSSCLAAPPLPPSGSHSSSLMAMTSESGLGASAAASSASVTSSMTCPTTCSILSQHLAGTDMHYYSYLLHAAHQRQQQQQQQRQQEEQERHKQMMAVLGLERERRRQQVLLIKAMEARKKEEEKERLKEEKKSAKKLDREKKLEQKRLELFIAREQKKPMEDMCIADGKVLPELERIHGVKLAGRAFADCLMILEFVHNFSSSLGFDGESLPTMKTLQGGLLNEDDCCEEFMAFVSHLMRFALEDPGMANPKEAMSQSGQKLNDIDLSDDNISELMRIFIRSRNGKDDEMTDWLKMRPFQSLNPTQKAAILAYLCNELLGSKSVTGEIEKNIDGINNLRRDKWIVEGKLRKLRILQAKRFRKVIPLKGQQSEDSNTTTTGVTSFNNKKDTDEEAEESGNESDDAPPSHADGGHDSDAEEDQAMSSEELDAKIEKLIKQQNQFREKIFNVAHRLSAVSFGQDRFRRRYWILPKCGGIFVEGLESAEPEIFETMGEEQTAAAAEDADDKKRDEQQKPPEMETLVAEENSLATVAESVVRETDAKSALSAAEETMVAVERRKDSAEVNGGGGGGIISLLRDASPLPLPNATQDLNGDLNFSQSTSVAATAPIISAVPVAVTSVSAVTLSTASISMTTASMTNEKHLLSPSMSCLFGSQSNLVNLGDIVSQTVMNSLGQEDPPESEFLAEPKHEGIRVKQETEVKPNLMELFDINYRLKLEPKLFKDGGCLVAEEKPVFKFEARDSRMDGDLKPSRLSFTKSENSLELPQQTIENSPHVAVREDSVVAKSEDAMPAAEVGKVDGSSSIMNFSSLCGGLPTSMCSTPSSASAAAALSSFRSIDSILQPDLKTKSSAGLFVSSLATNMSSPAPYFVSPSSTQTTEAAQWNLNRSIQNGTWFSVLPRVPCDVSTLKPPPQQTSCPPPPAPPLTPDLSRANTPRPTFGCPSVCCTPSSSMTTSYTLTPVKSELFGDDLLMTSGDLDLQSEYALPHQDTPPIPSVYRRGWWRISNPEQIKELLSCLNLRGIRERNLQKSLEKHLDLVCVSNMKTKKSIVKLEVTTEEESKSSSSASTSSSASDPLLASTGVVPAPAPCPDDKDRWNHELQRKMEIKVLEDIESMEERVCHASLEVKHREDWKMSPRVTTNGSIELVSSYETDLQPNQRYILDAARSRLLFLEHNIARRYLKPPLGRSTQLNLANMSMTSSKDNVTSSDDDSDADEETATKDLSFWRSAVASATSSAQLCLYTMQLNKCIAWEKSIMKVSCQICCCDDNEAELLLCDICDRGYHTYCVKPKIESIPEGDWYCYECISKASGDTCCVVCGRHGNRLATCEFCRRRAHIDCLDPPLARMPKKWSCNSCAVEKGKMKKKHSRPVVASSVTMASSVTSISATLTPVTSTPVTLTPVKDIEKELNGIDKEVAGVEESLVAAEETTKFPDDEVSLQQQASTPNSLSSEKSAKSGKSKNEKIREKQDAKTKKVEEEEEDEAPVEKETPATCNGSNASDEDMSVSRSGDMSICRTILDEMKKHPDAWPFLTPVNAKQFPTYRKVIRSPIDFKTMSRKLRSNVYKALDEFAVDARLVFSNCELFNEDDSSVGRAGHSMKLFFEKRWTELTTKQ